MALALSVGAIAGRPAIAQRASAGDPAQRFELEVEAGPVWQGRNDVQIPNESGTRFSLVDLLGSGPSLAYRVAASWRVGDRHGLRLLVAPQSISGVGRLDRQVDFAGATFEPSVPTEALYRFNSYRLTYRYRIWAGRAWTGLLGFTAKVRDAKVELRQTGVTARDANIGFVPLLHATVAGRLAPRWRVVAELDALAAPQGRAEDLALKLSYQPDGRWSVAAGYRTLEGGADVDAVYTFAWLHYAVLSMAYRL